MRRADFDCGLAAGLAAAGTLYVLMNLDFDPGPRFLSPGDVVKLAWALTSYLLAAALVSLFQRNGILRRVPSWVLVSIIGSALFVEPLYFYRVYERARAFEWEKALALLAGVTFYVAPFAASVYYSGRIVCAIRKWHDGPDRSNLSILR